jgi:hypothetical protein
MCTLRQHRPSHQAPHGTYVTCKGCHAAKCFAHILEGCVHASEAILAAVSDSDSTTWHRLHQEAKNRQIQVVFGPSAIGGVPPLRIRLVYYASNFACSSPAKSWMMSGFYDVPAASAIVVSNSSLAYVHARNEPPRNLERLQDKQSQGPQPGHQLQVRFQELARFLLLSLQRTKMVQPTTSKIRGVHEGG